jgi:hypothetical protein
MFFMSEYDKQIAGTSFKSWGEEQIARMLDRYSIPYRYEQPVAVIDNGKTKIWYPDFWLRDSGLIIEYFGVNGEKRYDEQTRHKLDVYRESGIDGLFLNRDSLRGDWPGNILGRIDSILEGRLARFRSLRRK